MRINEEIFEAFLQSPDWSNEKTINIFNKMQEDNTNSCDELMKENEKLQERINILKTVTETCLRRTFTDNLDNSPCNKKDRKPKYIDKNKLQITVAEPTPFVIKPVHKKMLQELFDFVNFEVFHSSDFEDTYKKIVIKYHSIYKRMSKYIQKNDLQIITNVIIDIEKSKRYSRGMWEIYNALNKNIFGKYL